MSMKHPPYLQGKPEKGSVADRIIRYSAFFFTCFAAIAAVALPGLARWNRAPEVSDKGLKLQTSGPVISNEIAAPSSYFVSERITLPSVPPHAEHVEEVRTVRREGIYTLLVVGRDRVGLNTDTIMAVQLDTKANSVNVVSIPRDTLVNVPWGVKKVNSLYGNRGIEGLVDGIEDLIGIPIDNYVVLNTQVFQEVIDRLGGVWFDVPQNMNYDDPDQNLHIHLSAGYQLLNGAQAEGLVRFRQNNDGSGYAQGDLDRIKTQHAFLKAAVKQLFTLGNLSNLPGLIELVVSNTDTDLSAGNIVFYAQDLLKTDSDGIRFFTMPYDAVCIRGGSYVSIRLQPWLAMINEYLNPFNVDVTAKNLDVITYGDAGLTSTTGRVPGFESFYKF